MNAPVRICAMYLSQVGAQPLDVETIEREVNQSRGAFALDEQQLAAVAMTVSTWRLENRAPQRVADAGRTGRPDTGM